jgi:radical SAM-linked protein
VRLRFAKHGKVRFTSHRDVARAFERAFRIAALPLAFSRGFSPHPRVSFGLALPTGAESDAEYLDLDLTAPVDVDALPATLTAALPEGLTVTAAAPLEPRAPALMEDVTACEWQLVVRLHGAPLTPGALAGITSRALACGALPVARQRKGRAVVDDVREVIEHLEVLDATDDGVRVHLRLTARPRSAKPDDVLAAVATATGTDGLVVARARRTVQWIERDGARREPLCAPRPRRATGTRDTEEGIDGPRPDPRDRRTERVGAGALPDHG